MGNTPKPLFVAGADGNRIHLADWGGDGAPLLLLHGMGANTHWWDSVVPLLASDRRVLAMDLRGHGESDWLEPPRYSIEHYAEDVEAVRAALGWGRFALAAHSLGARVALRYASTAPRQLAALALLDFLAVALPAHARYERRTKTRQPSYESEAAAAARFRLQPPGTLLSREALDALGRRCVRQAKDGRWSWKFDWRGFYFEYHPVFDEAAAVRVPTLLVRGEHSLTMPRAAFQGVLAALTDARGLVIPGAHHHVTLDAPRETAEALAGFLATVRP